MAYDFPATPTEGQLFTPVGGQTYQYQGGRWLITNTGVSALPIGVVMPYAGAAAPAGWLLCFGQNVSRTTYAALFAAIGTGFGVGDGSTTFGLPDLRGRVVAGKDNMGGASADRLSGYGGFDGDTLGAVGGTQSHILATTEIPAHAHTVAALANTVGADDPDHAHRTYANTGAVSADHGHTTYVQAGHASNTASGGSSTRLTSFAGSGDGANFSSGGISANHSHLADSWSGGRNVTHAHAVTTPAHSTDNAGSGTAHANVQPTAILNQIIYAGA